MRAWHAPAGANRPPWETRADARLRSGSRNRLDSPAWQAVAAHSGRPTPAVGQGSAGRGSCRRYGLLPGLGVMPSPLGRLIPTSSGRPNAAQWSSSRFKSSSLPRQRAAGKAPEVHVQEDGLQIKRRGPSASAKWMGERSVCAMALVLPHGWSMPTLGTFRIELPDPADDPGHQRRFSSSVNRTPGMYSPWRRSATDRPCRDSVYTAAPRTGPPPRDNCSKSSSQR